MTGIVPPRKPDATRADVLSFITDGEPLPPFPFLVGRRGYFGDAMGVVHANDINLYDDALFLVEEDRVTAFNANCDPTRSVPHMATLAVGRWPYQPGTHNQSKDPAEHPHYRALVQAGPVRVHRQGEPDDVGLFGINIHCGGNTVTSSAGCQTVPPAQWGALDRHVPGDFMYEVDRALTRVGRSRLSYILTSRYG